MIASLCSRHHDEVQTSDIRSEKRRPGPSLISSYQSVKTIRSSHTKLQKVPKWRWEVINSQKSSDRNIKPRHDLTASLCSKNPPRGGNVWYSLIWWFSISQTKTSKCLIDSYQDHQDCHPQRQDICKVSTGRSTQLPTSHAERLWAHTPPSK